MVTAQLNLEQLKINAECGIKEYFHPSLQKIQPLVSVTISTYNHVDWISQAIEGVLVQRCSFPFEIIISDDASNDGTTEKCIDFQRRYPGLIRLITAEKNYGSKTNLYRLHKKVRGKYIALCEGDDFWVDPQKLELQIEAFRKFPDATLVFGRTRNVKMAKKEVYDKYFTDGQRVNSELPRFFKIDPEKFLYKNHSHTSSLLFLSTIGLPDAYWNPFSFGDRWIHLLCMEHGPAVFIDRHFSIYRYTGKGMWSGLGHAEQLRRRNKNMEGLCKYAQEKYSPLLKVTERRLFEGEIILAQHLLKSASLRVALSQIGHLASSRRLILHPSLWRDCGEIIYQLYFRILKYIAIKIRR